MVRNFPHFPWRVENKEGHGSQRLFNIFSNVLQTMTGVIKFCKNVPLHWKSAGGCHTTSFAMWKMGCNEKEKTSNISDTIPLIFFKLSSCVGKIIGYPIKITGMILTAQSKVEVNVTFYSFSHVSAILWSILTRFEPQWWYCGLWQKYCQLNLNLCVDQGYNSYRNHISTIIWPILAKFSPKWLICDNNQILAHIFGNICRCHSS